ncbi:MAG: LacI family DNA-binding transcriptional regulator [Bifidobacteriaceae bacterium]|nr:LacI family DNA-binding transcriptional regulator [Bifidobacteriaceae bacterium]
MPRVKIADVAAEARLSVSSVSVALNGRGGVSEATRDRVRQIAANMGYTPSLVRGIETGSYTRPKLTAVKATPTEVGRVSWSMLMELIEDRSRPPWTVDVPLGPMVAGGSVAVPGPSARRA